MANAWYNHAAKMVLDGTLNVSSSTLKVMLVTSGYTFNRDHDFVDAGGANDPIDAELSGTGYTAGFGGAGRKTIANKVFTEDDTNDLGWMDCDDVVWTAINAGTAAACIVIKEITNDAASLLIAFFDSGFPKVTNGGDLTLQINAAGLLQLLTT